MFEAMRAAESGLAADRLWLDLVSANLANTNDVQVAGAAPYQQLEPVFQATTDAAGLPDGVEVTAIVASPAPAQPVYDPGASNAAGGFVAGSNVDLTSQMLDLIAASRAYEANVAAFKAAKSDAQAAIQM